MIHATPFGYPPQSRLEIGQDSAEAIMAAQDAEFVAVRFEEAPDTSKQDAVQAIIAHCMEGEDAIKSAGFPPDKFDSLRLIGYLQQTLRQILEECRRLT